jgi:hypothetical protein
VVSYKQNTFDCIYFTIHKKTHRSIVGFLILIITWISSCGETIPIDCATEEECTTENEDGFQTGTVASIAAGGAAIAALAGGFKSSGVGSSEGNSADSSYASSVCTFGGTEIVHGTSASAYQNASIPFGSSCIQETRTCSNGTLSGSFQFSSCIIKEDTNPHNASITENPQDHFRLLTQTTFDPDRASLEQVDKLGVEGWIDHQLNMGSA